MLIVFLPLALSLLSLYVLFLFKGKVPSFLAVHLEIDIKENNIRRSQVPQWFTPLAAPPASEMSSVDLDSAGRPFDNIINFRDVGKSVNKLYGSQYGWLFFLLLSTYPCEADLMDSFSLTRILKEGILFRSARVTNNIQYQILHTLQSSIHPSIHVGILGIGRAPILFIQSRHDYCSEKLTVIH